MGAVELAEPWKYELIAEDRGFQQVAGVDEAGCGPLAGPVVAAAVLLPRNFDTIGIYDSKKLTQNAREAMYKRIQAEAIAVGVGIIGSDVIDQINILRATHTAMKAALDDMGAAFDFVLVDGRPVTGLGAPSMAIVKGDGKSVSIAAASIIAKVTRDRIMCELDEQYPEYGFAAHKGYSCKSHLDAINRLGPCPCHRMSFAPISGRAMQCRLDV